jgi:F-type H+-transporting ATPase subunit gamma
MANLKDLRTRIDSVRSTQKITRAMRMVAASRLRRAQERAEAARPYAERMARMMASLAANLTEFEGAPQMLVGTGREQTHLVVVATAERGLCGGFNSSIARAARRRIVALQGDGKTVKVLCVGKKGRDMLRRDFGDIIVDTVDLAGVRQISFAEAAPIADRLAAMFGAGEFDVCSIVYNHFQSVMTQIVTEGQLIPSPVGEAPPGHESGAVYEFEPDEAEILTALLPRNLAVQVYRALLENGASEQGARMTAMDSASRNAGEMIDRLTMHYNRTRQAVITNELIEIISGAEAL